MLEQYNQNKPQIDVNIFATSFILVAVFCLMLIIFPEAGGQITKDAMRYVVNTFGWLYLLTGVIPLVLCFWLAFGRFGHVKLGEPNEEPEYSNMSWIAMMFTAAIGASLIAWGFAEPVFYLQTPPLNAVVGSHEATELAHMYPLIHWSLVPWAMYCLPGLPVAYMLFNRKQKNMRISSACESFMPKNPNSLVRSGLDMFVLLGVVGGVGTSIGLGIILATSLFVETLGFKDDLTTHIFVIGIWTLIFGTSTFLGLKKGIRVLADTNIVLMFISLFFILIAGPTVYILSLTVNSIGLYLDNFVKILFWTDPINQSGFPQDWTIFYWAWWFAYAPMMGLFFGRISRGRTIKQYVLGVVGIGSLTSVVYLSVVGGFTLYLDQFNLLDTVAVLNNQGMGYLTTEVIKLLPAAEYFLILMLVLTIIFYATTFDSAAFIIASICTKNISNDEEPPRSMRVIWALTLGMVALGLMIVGGLEVIKAVTVVSSLPVIPIVLMMSYTLYTWLKEDEEKNKIYLPDSLVKNDEETSI